MQILQERIAEDLEPSADGELQSRLADSRGLPADAIAGIRDVCAELRPVTLDYAGLPRALQGYAEQFSPRTGIAVEVSCADHDKRPPADTESSLFRVAQEALTNCAKHSQATAIKVELAHEGGQTRLTISDNGGGSTPARWVTPNAGRDRGCSPCASAPNSPAASSASNPARDRARASAC